MVAVNSSSRAAACTDTTPDSSWIYASGISLDPGEIQSEVRSHQFSRGAERGKKQCSVSWCFITHTVIENDPTPMDNNFPCPHTESTLAAVTFLDAQPHQMGETREKRKPGRDFFFQRAASCCLPLWRLGRWERKGCDCLPCKWPSTYCLFLWHVLRPLLGQVCLDKDVLPQWDFLVQKRLNIIEKMGYFHTCMPSNLFQSHSTGLVYTLEVAVLPIGSTHARLLFFYRSKTTIKPHSWLSTVCLRNVQPHAGKLKHTAAHQQAVRRINRIKLVLSALTFPYEQLHETLFRPQSCSIDNSEPKHIFVFLLNL